MQPVKTKVELLQQKKKVSLSFMLKLGVLASCHGHMLKLLPISSQIPIMNSWSEFVIVVLSGQFA